MHNNIRILLVTSRNLDMQTGEWRLISERSMALNELGIETDIIYIRKGDIYKRDIFIKNIILDFKLKSPLLYIIHLCMMLSKISKWLRKYPNGKILLSGFQLYPISFLFKSNRILIDIHGTLDEWVELTSTTRKARLLKFLYPLVKYLEQSSLRRSFGAVVVSTPLVKWAYENKAKNVWLFPCLPHSAPPLVGNADRQAMRRKLGYQDTDIVLVYSGGLSSWQCVEEGLILFSGIKEVLPQIKMLILTPASAQAEKIMREYRNIDIRLLSADPEDVASLLSSTDIALMLRDSNSTNYYAFPNKFAEYVYAGLAIISSPGLYDPAQIIESHNLGLLLDPKEIRVGLSIRLKLKISESIIELSSSEKRLERVNEAIKYVSSEIYAFKLAQGLGSCK